MSFELIHTSVEKSLRGGAGFATAVATEGMPPGLENVLAEMSAFEVDSARSSGADEVDWCHRIVTLQGRSYTVLSRVGGCGPDWSGRPNRVAHHLVLDASERPEAGPAWALANFGEFSSGVPEVEWRKTGPRIPVGSLGPRVPSHWAAAGFDPGWAGMVASALLDGGGATVYLVLPGGRGTLSLVEDVFAILPKDRRWNTTFSTRFQRAPVSSRCQLRCVRAGAPGVASLLAEPGCRKIVVTPGTSAGEGPAAEAARSGREVAPATRTPSTRIEPVKLATPVHVEPVSANQVPAAKPTRATVPAPAGPDLASIARESRSIGRSAAEVRAVGGLMGWFLSIPKLDRRLFILTAILLFLAFVISAFAVLLKR